MPDLFEKDSRRTSADYGAKDIEVLEGLEPVRRRPGMYIGGTDERAMHHLVAEILDNSMDEAVAGHASRIEMELDKDGFVTIRDNGRGIPVEPHPKIKGKTALEVAMTMLHAGGKFGGKAYSTSGGLHGVGLSVVNALSDQLTVESVRSKELYTQEYSRGKPVSKLKKVGAGHQPPRHLRPLPRRPADLRQGEQVPRRAALSHGALQGLPVPRRGDPLALRSEAGRGR